MANKQTALNYGKHVIRKVLTALEVALVKKQARHKTGIKAFGERLRQVRLEKGFTQERLAYASDLEFSQISRIERGVINTSISQVFQIAEALGVHWKELFDFDVH